MVELSSSNIGGLPYQKRCSEKEARLRDNEGDRHRWKLNPRGRVDAL
ncbi:hypothetical protein PDIG_89740 [Penicillium digitatum PHI26]|uniref:Uncharacterized protein n=2 Tax=Penicillium digitatum TaxID=36651 RepID=K9F5Q3_PEND2|nr:hypothetical protein PDIP_06670 [Penicillium digitatum Pd1]EKV04339.1 hypothetical protein PDIG_89740 [Penicillium digitatum PHI26]EKV21408.1 hypothetical protein PDIP_06670 [Penicillium digitatum Pd1]